ncbi:uncharacterized protein LOC141627721 [Silene latifolia]|uniref:uncharacterized protein LOC141627721 n=1 Tax=Silene latifolia TaxID=37657 RepID=UPI003D78329D
MVSIGLWNIRGLNKKNKQGDVRRLLHINKVGLFGLMETKVKTININKVQDSLGDRWHFLNNNALHEGGRIWILWDPTLFHVNLLMKDMQGIHVVVVHLMYGFLWTCSFVYGFNKDSERVGLWQSLYYCKAIVTGPWLIMGDFNNVLYAGERIGSNVTLAETRDFQNCVDTCGLYDLVTQGIASFLPEGLFDHSPSIINLWEDAVRSNYCFKYFNMWGQDDRFKETVLTIWQQQIKGCKMFQVAKKLKLLKHPLRKLNKEGFGDILNTTKVAQLVLEDLQKRLHQDPWNVSLQAEERAASISFKELDKARNMFLNQKAKILWMKCNDENSHYFHSSSKAVVRVNLGVVRRGACITDAQAAKLIQKEFFDSGTLLKQLNATVVTLIPKKEVPETVMYYRPIACCNVLFKCISKVICARLALVLPDIISPNQSAFIHGREIVDNVLICQDLMRLYNRRICSPRIMMKIDLKKEYDSIEWSFVEDMLVALKVPDQMVTWIMQCVTTPSYTLALNGSHFGYFKGGRGLRQGDPLSPLLFTICLEYLTRILNVVTLRHDFRFHPMCRELGLCHLAFADDLLLFSRGDTNSVMVLMRALHTFSIASGLTINKLKSDIYMNGLTPDTEAQILGISGFKKGSFPFRYLGVDISYKRLTNHQCNKLVDRMVLRIHSWGAKQLSYAGRLTLVKTVLTQLHCYWARIYLLPKGVIQKVDSICRNYLWSGKDGYHESPQSPG